MKKMSNIFWPVKQFRQRLHVYKRNLTMLYFYDVIKDKILLKPIN